MAYVGFLLVNPQLLDLLIEFVEEKQEMWKGYLYTGLLAIVSFLIGNRIIFKLTSIAKLLR